MIWQIKLHHAGRHAVVTDQQVRMTLLPSLLHMLRKIRPALGPTQWVIPDGQSEKNYGMKENCPNQTQS